MFDLRSLRQVVELEGWIVDPLLLSTMAKTSEIDPEIP